MTEPMRRKRFDEQLNATIVSSTAPETVRFCQPANGNFASGAIEPNPPPQAMTPTLMRPRPISVTTMPETSGVMIVRRRLKRNAATISAGAAQMQQPKMSGSP